MKPTQRQRAAIARQLEELEATIGARRRAREPFDPWAHQTPEERRERTLRTLNVMVDTMGADFVRETLLHHGLTGVAALIPTLSAS